MAGTTPEGNIFAQTDAEAATASFSEKEAKNRDELDRYTKVTAEKALDTAKGYAALISTARSDASTAKADAANAVDRVENLETLGGVAPGDVNDANAALHINQPGSQTRTALDAVTVQTISERASAVITDDGYATLQAVVDAAAPGDTVEIRQAWTITAPVTVSKPLTIRGARSGKVTTSGNVHAFEVTASDVTFDSLWISGNGGNVAGTQAAIRGIGSAAFPLLRVAVRNCQITSFGKYGIEGEHWHSAIIEDNRITTVAYAGIMLTSPKGGTIARNTIRDVTQPSGFVNSYGISVTRNSAATLTDSPRAADVFITGNTVDGVPKWEGIDTHAGENIVIKDNIVRNTNVGIALVPGVNSSGVDTYAPKRIKVLNNTIASTVTTGIRSIGIQLVGCVATVDSVTEYADAVIQGNTVDGHGQHDTANTGAIFLQATIGTVVTGNVLTEAGLNAIHATHNNKTLTVDNNTAVDTWSDSLSYTSMLRVSSHHNTIKFGGNLVVRANKTATTVNARGLFVSTGLNNVSIQWGDNDMNATTLPKIDGGLSFSRMGGTKLAFTDAGTPVTRPALAAAATDEVTARALINQVRTALINYGLTT